jgi:hypothetical protein
VFRHVPLVLLVVCLSCGDGTRPVGPPADNPAHAMELTASATNVISPGEGTIAPGQTLQFTATLFDPQGNP